MKWLCFSVLILTQSGCLSALLGSQDSKSRSYKLAAPGPDWKAIDPVDADSAYRHEGDKALLNVSSFCGDERLKSLEELADDVMRQLPEGVLRDKPEIKSINGHPAIAGSAFGKVDANTIEVQFVVIRSPQCVYDIILAGPRLGDASRNDFAKTVQNFREGR